jgi:hypothetical protein
MGERKAYVITEECEGSAVVVYAAHRATAQSDGANELDMEFTEVTCRRAPEFDGLEHDRRALAEAQLEAGWWLGNGHGDRFASHDDPWISKSGDVWRSPWEWLAETERQIRREAAEAAAVARVTSELWGQFWFADRIEAHSYQGKHVYAEVWLPYMHGPLSYREEKGEKSMTIQRRDQDIWPAVALINQDARIEP